MKNNSISIVKKRGNLKIVFFYLIGMLINYTVVAAEGKVITISYHSTTQNTLCNMNVYLPAGYDEPADTSKYPVFYLFHGGGENYTHWYNYGSIKATLDNYISAGTAVPMILVMPDCKDLAPETFSNEMINDIIPYIESNYRVLADKDHRGVGGLSWGGLQAMDLGIYHYEMFGYSAILSSGWFTSETATYQKARTFLGTNSSDMEKSIRYLYFSEGTSSDIAYENGQATLKVFRDYDLTVHYWEHPGGHTWTAWKEDFKAFVPYLFRDSTTRYISLEFQGGVITKSTIMTNLDSVVTPPTDPTRAGYTFSGWFKEPECTDSFNFATNSIKSSITLYAKWNINYYKISFNTNGGNYTPDTLEVCYKGIIEEPLEPQKSGLFFKGWYTDSTFTKKWDFSTNLVTKDITLIAKWSDSNTSVNEDQVTDIVLYPNPAHSYLQIVNLQSDTKVDIFSLDGRLMIHKELLSSQDSFSIEKLPEGIYVIRINSLNETNSYKFIKN